MMKTELNKTELNESELEKISGGSEETQPDTDLSNFTVDNNCDYIRKINY